MKVGKRMLAIGAILVAFAAVMATQYATASVQASINITGKYPWIQFMAHDKDARDGGWLLRRSGDTLNYTIYLANISGGQIKIWTAAFAIVNTEKHYQVYITGVRLWGSDIVNYMEVTVHSDPDAVGVDTAENSYEPPANSYWDEDSSALLLWKGTAIGGPGTVDNQYWWVLGPGNGYDKNKDVLYYGTSSAWIKAQYDSTYYVFNYTTYNNPDNTAQSTTDNFVWVQIIIDLSDVSDVSALAGEQTIYMEFYFQGNEV